MMRVLGAVLAGGRSTRFGSDKAAALLEGRALIAHVLAALECQVDALAVCGRGMAGVASLADRPGLGLGPLGGIAAALHHAAVHGFAGVVTVPCDAPRLPADLVARLRGEGAAYVAGQPVIGWWPVTLAPLIDAHLARDPKRSLRGWAATAGARAIALDIPNINTPEALAALAANEVADPRSSPLPLNRGADLMSPLPFKGGAGGG